MNSISVNLIERLNAYLLQLAPHQKSRKAAKLLMECAEELRRLHAELDEADELRTVHDEPS